MLNNEPRRYICERCGGTGVQEAGRYWDCTQKEYVEMPEQTCQTCDGTGLLGLIESKSDEQ